MKSNRQTNKTFTILLFTISFVFAYFLLQAGSLVIKQIPSVGLNLTVKDLVDQKEIKKINNNIDDLKSEMELLLFKNNAIKTKHRGQKKNLNFEKQNYKELLASRYVTEDVKSNTKIENLRKKIETKRRELQNTSSKITLLDNEIAVLEHKTNLLNKEKRDLNYEAIKILKEKREWNNFKEFLIRLSFVLPLLLIAFFLLKTYRKSDYWPFVYGWGYFSVYAFFIELVPYFPSYGGYIRSIIGVGITFVLGKLVISKLKIYLEQKKKLEQQDEQERHTKLQESESDLEETFSKIAKNICPSCDRKFINDDNKYCIYCGLCIRKNCTSCNALQISFSKYCLECGVKKEDKSNSKKGD
jgi:hypothetical protein